ncbi:hypothetical protein GZL_08201 [Streptomyces sp. 769]|nr:hypothetical protein GZL_08201 [Streptomyces sp. 769]
MGRSLFTLGHGCRPAASLFLVGAPRGRGFENFPLDETGDLRT